MESKLSLGHRGIRAECCTFIYQYRKRYLFLARHSFTTIQFKVAAEGYMILGWPVSCWNFVASHGILSAESNRL